MLLRCEELHCGGCAWLLRSVHRCCHRAVSPLVSTLEAALAAAAAACKDSSVLLAYRCSDVLTPETLKAERKFFATLTSTFAVAEAQPQSAIEHVQLYSLRGC